MLSLHTIERAIENRDLDRLLRELTANGLDLPLPLRVRLSSSEAAGLALGLRRVVELTYSPTPLSRDLTARLLSLQNARGGFGEADHPAAATDPLTTACVVSALSKLLSDHRSIDNRDEVYAARDRAIAALASCQAGDGLLVGPGDRTLTDRVRHTAFVLTLVGGCPAFRAGVRWADLLNWFDEHAEELDPVAEHYWTVAQAGESARRKADALLGLPLLAA